MKKSSIILPLMFAFGLITLGAFFLQKGAKFGITFMPNVSHHSSGVNQKNDWLVEFRDGQRVGVRK